MMLILWMGGLFKFLKQRTKCKKDKRKEKYSSNLNIELMERYQIASFIRVLLTSLTQRKNIILPAVMETDESWAELFPC